MDEPHKKAFVIGWPISHSLSPALHTYWLKHHNINGSYESIALDPGDLEEFLGNLANSGYVGGNITIPHKEAAYNLITNRACRARKLKAANTIWIESGETLIDNTDSYGFSANLDDFSQNWREAEKALVIGAGGAARAVASSLSSAGISQITIANRTKSKAREIATMIGGNCNAVSLGQIPDQLQTTSLLVNTTSMGMKDQPPLDIDLSHLPSTAIVTDIVYNPLMTPLLEQAAKLGLTTIDGIGMLLHQAVPGFEKWFGIRPKVTPELRSFMLNLLKEARS